MKPISSSFRATVQPVLGAVLALTLAPAAVLASAPTASALTAPANLAERPDQVFYLDRNGNARTQSGTITESTLDGVALEGRGSTIDAASITRVVFGDVPDAFRDAENYLARGDFENALQQFRMAADDSEARQVVRAAARLNAGKTLLRHAQFGGPATVFAEAVGEFDTFVNDYPTSRLLPEARTLGARARRLNGNAQAAGELGAAVFDELSASPDDAYTAKVCFDAGLSAAHAFYAAGDKAAGDALLTRMQDALTPLIGEAELEERDRLRLISDAISLAEGWGMLADERWGQAATFFSGKARADAPARLRNMARLGQAQALLGQGNAREAQIQFATVSAMATDRDTIAAALVGLAKATTELGDSDAKERVRAWLTSCIEQYGDTPAAGEARSLASDL